MQGKDCDALVISSFIHIIAQYNQSEAISQVIQFLNMFDQVIYASMHGLNTDQLTYDYVKNGYDYEKELFSRRLKVLPSHFDSINSHSPLHIYATDQDNLGFDNLLVGRIPISLLSLMRSHLSRLSHRAPSAEVWSHKFTQELLLFLFSHRQWTYRNGVKHFQPSEGLTVQEHNLIHQRVQSLFALPSSRLLPQHRHLLSPTLAHKLGSSSTTHKQFWIAEMQSALDQAAITLHLKRKNITSHNSYSCSKHSVVANTNCPLFPTSTSLQSNRSNKRCHLESAVSQT
jgi:hypothetical protein